MESTKTAAANFQFSILNFQFNLILTNPIFLLGLLAVGIPIAIHLLQLRRYKKVYFSNVDALQEIQNENRKQHRLRQWLVLAMRILAVVFVVLAFCRPTIPAKETPTQSGGTAVSVYLDNSYSMECGGMDGSLMESAKRKAREIAEAYRPDDRFQLLTGDADGSQFRWLSRDEFLAEVDAVQTSAATPLMASIARRQQDFLLSAPESNRHAYIVSDFQRSTANLADFPDNFQFSILNSQFSTTLIPLGGSGVDNLFLDTLLFNSPAYSRGATAVAEVTVCNNGSHAVEGIPLRLFVNGRQRALASVDIPSGGRTTVPLHFSIDEEGLLQGYVETVDYPVTFDDRLFFSLNVIRQVPLLVIGGEGENEYLRRLFAGDSLTDYHFMPATHIDYTSLADNNFILLDQLHDIPSGLAQTLSQFVADGGTLAIVPDEHASTESYNALLGALRAPLLGGWRQGKMAVQGINTTSDLYHGVFDGKAENMEMPTVQGSYALLSDSRTLREEVMTLADGTPLLTATLNSQLSTLNSIYLFSCPLRKEYTDLVQQALFVPTLYNMALYSVPRQQPYHLPGASDPIPMLTLNSQLSTLNSQVPHLTSTDSTVDLIPDIRRVGSRYVLVPHGEVRQAGNYRIGEEGLSFNYSRAESDLAVYSVAELRQLLRDNNLAYMGVRSYELMPNAAKSVTEVIRQRSQGVPLWRWCLLLALLALAAETILLRTKN